jgi:hypothetical protein
MSNNKLRGLLDSDEFDWDKSSHRQRYLREYVNVDNRAFLDEDEEDGNVARIHPPGEAGPPGSGPEAPLCRAGGTGFVAPHRLAAEEGPRFADCGAEKCDIKSRGCSFPLEVCAP